MAFQGNTVLVTGAASGMGKLAALRYAKAGKKVIALDLNLEGLQATARESQNIEVHAIDLCDYQAVEKLVNTLLVKYKSIDRLVQCAGIMPLGRLSEQKVELIQRIMDVNYMGTVNINLAVLPHMLARKSGEIINFASIAGWVPSLFFGAYDASKFAVVAYTEVLREELKDSGVKVYCVCPPPVNTPLLNNANNKPQVLEQAPAVEPGFVLDSMERGIEKGSLFIFPGVMNRIAYVVRRFFPRFIWWVTHLAEKQKK